MNSQKKTPRYFDGHIASGRAYNAFLALGVNNLGEYRDISQGRVARLRNVGLRTFNEMEKMAGRPSFTTYEFMRLLSWRPYLTQNERVVWQPDVNGDMLPVEEWLRRRELGLSFA